MSSLKWYFGAATSALAPLVPAVGDPMAWRATKVAGAFGRGASRLHPVGVFLGAAQLGYMGYTNRRMLYRETGYAGGRVMEGLTGGRYQAPAAAWERTPSQRFSERKTHGFFVNPRDRMERNPPMISSARLADQGYRT